MFEHNFLFKFLRFTFFTSQSKSLSVYLLNFKKMNISNSNVSYPKSNCTSKKKRVRKQLTTKCCRRTLPNPQGVKRPHLECPEIPDDKFKRTKDHPPTPFPHLYCKSPNYWKEYDFCLTQAKDLKSRIKASPFSRQGAGIIYKERLISSVGYCLPVTYFSQ